jgi:hypothetical protein
LQFILNFIGIRIKNLHKKFKKKVPKTKPREKIHVTVNESGTMDNRLMVVYGEKIVKPYLKDRVGCLVFDDFKAHTMVNSFSGFKCDTLSISGGFTSSLQPIDVSINKPFKATLGDAWNDWFNNTEPEFTKGNNRKKPSYDQLLDMVSHDMDYFDDKADMISKVIIT